MPYEIPACAGKPYRPSNGTEGMAFSEFYCLRCVHDAAFREYGRGGCDIISRAQLHDIGDEQYPSEWTHDERGRPTCTAFEEEEADHA